MPRKDERANDQTPMLTTKEVADDLQVDQRTVRRWREKNMGPSWHQLDRLVRYSREDYDSWKAGLRRSS